MQSQLKHETQAPYATSVIGANLQPDSVPMAQPDKTVTVENDYTASAHTCAERILKAQAGRFAAWMEYSMILPNIDHVPAAAQALQAELERMGYSRAKVEASEWRAFATVQHLEPDRAMLIVDNTRVVKILDKDGHAVKDSTGTIKTRRPTAAEIVDDLRSEREVLIKHGKVPAVLVPKTGKKRDSNAPVKLSAVQFDAIQKNLAVASTDQFGSLFVTYLTIASTRVDAAGILSTMHKMIQSKRQELGFIGKANAPATV